MTSPPDEHAYVERLSVPASWWLVGAFTTLTLWWVFVLATPSWFAIGAAVVGGVAIGAGLWQYGSARVEVTRLHLRAGTARIALQHCGEVEALDVAQTRALHGPQADARAFFCVRPYVHTAVRVEILDPRDPTPYWLVGSRHPQRLATALRSRRP
ncbi:DUF3093 domain-containing protein [Solicola sp. PLA-1-18]|uniref:DUF3093 domain-containing protein n=1 Tax=Solicola sp. PLA-1-18 TaxID=3380532 RepID=UPI003B805A77